MAIFYSVSFGLEGSPTCSKCGAMGEPMFYVVQEGLIGKNRVAYCERDFVRLLKAEPRVLVAALKSILQRLGTLERNSQPDTEQK